MTDKVLNVESQDTSKNSLLCKRSSSLIFVNKYYAVWVYNFSDKITRGKQRKLIRCVHK